MEAKDFAKVILRTATIREDSFNRELADNMSNEKFPDFKRCCQLSIEKATDIAIKDLRLDPKMSQPIYLLLYCAWNDSLAWANDIEAFEEAFKEEVK